MTCLVYYVDEGLSVAPLDRFDNPGCLDGQGDCLDCGGKFVPGDCAADQALQGLFILVKSEGRFRGAVRTP